MPRIRQFEGLFYLCQIVLECNFYHRLVDQQHNCQTLLEHNLWEIY
ncbi:hypothetical protein BpHYR1_049970 [Brachionus plicatilis]|uniref:Uncharacterized protein n=1 Tax=Brachionus plicatilis TaxID=10195 RepID=A0A3M7Q2G6_BRAPC|nr:hypothetical protein BpHYR1_049970 [Brachionus plicatilis]